MKLACTGAESRERRAAHADTLSAVYPALQNERRRRSLGGEAASSGERRSYLQPRSAPVEQGNDAAPYRRRRAKKGAVEGISRDVLTGLSRKASPLSEDHRLFQGKVCFGRDGEERERKGRDYSHGLQGFAEPGFQRLEVFYDHFNHHPERPGPPASPAAAATTAAGSAPPRRPGPRLLPHLPPPAEAAAAAAFGRERPAEAGGPATRRGRNQPSSGGSLRAPLSPLLSRESGLPAPQFPPASAAGGGQELPRA